ncbi:MAG: hypothetical protein AAGK37_08060 [Pseudomonadota bacterium]
MLKDAFALLGRQVPRAEIAERNAFPDAAASETSYEESASTALMPLGVSSDEWDAIVLD